MPYRRLLALLVPCCVLTLAAVALAQAPYEPNDSAPQARGPLAGGQAYSAALENAGDEDWYVFYATGQRQLDIALTNQAPPSCPIYARALRPEDLSDDLGNTTQPDFGETRHIRFTTGRASSKYYLQVGVVGSSRTCDPSSGYSFIVTPPDAIGAAPSAGSGRQTVRLRAVRRSPRSVSVLIRCTGTSTTVSGSVELRAGSRTLAARSPRSAPCRSANSSLAAFRVSRTTSSRRLRVRYSLRAAGRQFNGAVRVR